MDNKTHKTDEKTIEWPAWCMAFAPAFGLALLSFTSVELDWVAWMVIYVALWVIDYANLRKLGVSWVGVIGVIILPPIYLLSRTRALQDGRHYFGVSCFVLLLAIIIALYA